MVEPVTINLRFLAREIGLPQEQVQAVVALLDDGFPVSFIARYRKDQTDNMDEENLRLIDTELKAMRALCERKQTILKTIDSQGKLTPELDKKIREAKSLKRLEDLYLPFKPKKQTLAATARQRGLEALALEIVSGKLDSEKLDGRASEFVDEDKKVLSIADALLGAGHIIAEMFAEKIEVLHGARDLIHRNGKVVSKKIETKKPVEAEKIPAKQTEKQTEIAPESVSAAPPDSPNSPENDGVSTASPTETAASDQTTEMPVVAVVEETPTESASEPATENNEPTVVAAEPSSEESPTEETPVEEAPSEDSVKTEADEVTEQFQQWKEAQLEQGLPTVQSQNTLKKKKREEARKKKAEAKTRKQEHFERQFGDYFNFTGPVRNMPAHRIMAMNRGERAKVLRVKVDCDEAQIFAAVREACVPADHPLADFMDGCLKDALRRLVVPSMERELRGEMTEYAERQAIGVFAKNLRNLLLQPPLRRKRVLALDPGVKHGCKMVSLDEFGNVLDFETVYLVGGAERKEKAIQKIGDLIRKFGITVIAIGNGTGSRETEECVTKLIATQFADSDLAYIMVNEAGASVYSASPIAREEFPDYDVLLRGAVSIGRRLQDPLNELVKIEPSSLGVGMYQHDLKGKHLKDTLTEVVESCVNFVGVDLNTATFAILRYVAGLNQLTAKRIYDYRREHGPFRSRVELKKVPGFGDAAFTHSAGFLKIPGGAEPLDATWIHPESYELAGKILEKLGFSVDDLRSAEKTTEIAAAIRDGKVGELASRFASELGAGLFTVRDILDNLARPGRDPREALPAPIFRKGVLKMEDLSPGMELSGTVLNVVDFGAFIDVGLHESGLVHISQMADRYIRDAHDKVSVGDVVRVWVVEADPKRKRISLSMLPPGTEKQHQREQRRDRDDHSGGERSERPKRENQARDRKPQGDRPPRQDGEQRPRRDGDNRGRDNRGRDNRGRGRDDRRDRGPKTFVAPPKEKSLKPITDEMKKGKEPMRSFGDLAQLLGRVQVPDQNEEKKRKKEEERKRRESEKKAESSVETAPVETAPVESPPVEETTSETASDATPNE